MDSNATAAFVREHGAQDVVLISSEYWTPRMVRGIAELCDHGTRVLAVMRLSSLTNEARIHRSMRFLERYFEAVDSMHARAVEKARWLPSGFKMGAMEFRPRKGGSKRTSPRHSRVCADSGC
ncbi:unnamed protein product [Prorocentrum cordatum]|uniref:Uncharacterized protein n=1 Tax=Prorocentrum cordatum TaxID=2364126 RepID=A0ABN9RGA9_9DINO|nr:unnamed protein product [Polarella glacialis]